MQEKLPTNCNNYGNSIPRSASKHPDSASSLKLRVLRLNGGLNWRALVESFWWTFCIFS